MMQALLAGALCGFLIGVAITLQSADMIRHRRDQKLAERNDYLEGEVARLRAQVAFYINPWVRHEEYPTDQRIAA
jgi:hypothetical protein